MVGNKLHREHRGGSIGTQTVKNTDLNGGGLSQTNVASQANLKASSKTVPEVSNTDQMTVQNSILDKGVEPHSRIIKKSVSNQNQQQQLRPILNREPEVHSKIANIPAAPSSSHQQDGDSIETSLAKITCSQRAICSSIHSLV